jgi:hypothetical protein
MPVLERGREFLMRAAREQVAHRLDGTKPHPRRSARGEDAEDHLLPQTRVRGRAPHLVELFEARAYLAPSCAVRGANLLDGDGLSLSSHYVSTDAKARLTTNLSKFYGRRFGLVKRKCATSVEQLK